MATISDVSGPRGHGSGDFTRDRSGWTGPRLLHPIVLGYPMGPRCVFEPARPRTGRRRGGVIPRSSETVKRLFGDFFRFSGKCGLDRVRYPKILPRRMII